MAGHSCMQADMVTERYVYRQTDKHLQGKRYNVKWLLLLWELRSLKIWHLQWKTQDGCGVGQGHKNKSLEFWSMSEGLRARSSENRKRAFSMSCSQAEGRYKHMLSSTFVLCTDPQWVGWYPLSMGKPICLIHNLNAHLPLRHLQRQPQKV